MKAALTMPVGILLLMAIVAMVVLCGCTLTVSPDGSRTYTPDPQAYRAVGKVIADRILDEK